MALLDSSSVAVDGAALRRIREEKRLTQLYVSKVVGVTTDTVSRWENNRYPTIRRDNAVKLAEALEVDLDEIIKKEQSSDPSPGDHPPPKSITKFWPLFVFALVALFLLWFFFPRPDAVVDLHLTAQRLLPPHVAPGHELLVQVVLSAERPLKGMILKEEFPPGWRFVSSEPEVASLDRATGVARWIFRNPEIPLYVYYRLEVPQGLELDKRVRVTGELIANPEGQQFILPIAGDQSTWIRPFHWADTNANYVIDDMEILLFSELTENTTELDDEWYLVEQIWHSGSYRWDDVNFRFVPLAETEKSDSETLGDN